MIAWSRSCLVQHNNPHSYVLSDSYVLHEPWLRLRSTLSKLERRGGVAQW
jgi:hypothetical protein